MRALLIPSIGGNAGADGYTVDGGAQMPRPQKNPAYDAGRIIKELMSAVAESYEETDELKITAEEFFNAYT